jgi:hypothetical protein
MKSYLHTYTYTSLHTYNLMFFLAVIYNSSGFYLSAPMIFQQQKPPTNDYLQAKYQIPLKVITYLTGGMTRQNDKELRSEARDAFLASSTWQHFQTKRRRDSSPTTYHLQHHHPFSLTLTIFMHTSAMNNSLNSTSIMTNR